MHRLVKHWVLRTVKWWFSLLKTQEFWKVLCSEPGEEYKVTVLVFWQQFCFSSLSSQFIQLLYPPPTPPPPIFSRKTTSVTNSEWDLYSWSDGLYDLCSNMTFAIGMALQSKTQSIQTCTQLTVLHANWCLLDLKCCNYESENSLFRLRCIQWDIHRRVVFEVCILSFGPHSQVPWNMFTWWSSTQSQFALRMHCGWWLLKWCSRDLTIAQDAHGTQLWLFCVLLIELHSLHLFNKKF